MISMSERLQNVFQSPDPARALRSLVQDLADHGMSRDTIRRLLENNLVHLREGKRPCDRAENALSDTLDALSGWCHPMAELLPEQSRKTDSGA
jgi:hypothetical protein